MTQTGRQGTRWFSNYLIWLMAPATGMLVFAFSLPFILDVLAHPLTGSVEYLALTVWMPYVLLLALAIYLLVSFLFSVFRIPIRIGVSIDQLHLDYLLRPSVRLSHGEIEEANVDKGGFTSRMRISTTGGKVLRIFSTRRTLEELEREIHRFSHPLDT